MTAKMYIKVVPKGRPSSEGRWIEVERLSERFLGWEKTVELYSPLIPKGCEPISFSRWPENCW